MAIIEVNHLTKQFEYYAKSKGLKGTLQNFLSREKLKKVAVDDVSFTVERGETVGLLGPNGAGKTTTLKMLSGILFPSSGTISVAGYTPLGTKKRIPKEVFNCHGAKNAAMAGFASSRYL